MQEKEMTAADVWRLFAESDRRTKEQMQEQRQEADRQMTELRKELSDLGKRIDGVTANIESLGKRMDDVNRKTSKELSNLGKQIGGVSTNIGLHAEQYFQDALRDSLVFGGQKYDKLIANLSYNHKSINMEFDIVLINGKNVAIIEAKNRIHPEFVKELAEKKLPRFKKCFPEFCKNSIYLGIAGFSFDKTVLSDAKARGIGIIRQVGKSIEISKDKLRAY